jgi:PAS domain S-box-containing protein
MQGTLVALVILLLFHLRKQLGIGVMFACLGLFQFVQVFLYSTVYVSITDNLNVSPGSAVFFTATLFVLLMVYIKEDASETKKIIYALVIVNIVMSVLSRTLNWHFADSTIQGSLEVSPVLFNISSWELLVGTITLFLDALLIILLFEFISRKVQFLFLQISLTMLIVVSFDTLCFLTLTFWGLENLTSIIISGLISKGVFTIFYSILLYSYLRFFDSTEPLKYIFNLKDVFQPLTYKQKFESAEKEIKETAEMHRILTEHSNDLICLQELDSTFRYISPSIKMMLGYEQSEFLGKQVFSIVHKDDVLSLKEALSQKKFSEGLLIDAFPFRIRHKDGHFVWLEFLVSPIYEDNRISYFVTTTRDITQRVLAKEKIQASIELLEKSENSLKEASKIAKIGYQEYDIATDTYKWSDYVYDIYGLDYSDQVPSMKEIISIFDDKSQEIIKEISEILITKGTPCDVELRCINLKKEEVWVRYVAKAVYNQKDEIIGRRGVLHNITASKKAQIELVHSKQKIQNSLELLERREYSMNEASKIAKIGYWEHNLVTGAVLWSEYVYDIFEINPKEGIPLQEEIYKNFTKESVDKLMQVTLDLITNGVSYDVELKWINQKKEEVWLRNVGQPVYNKEKEIIGKRGVMQNITASKNAQLELEFSKQKIQATLELLEKSEYSKNEASKTAKIGFLEDDIATETYIWSDYLYHIFGFDSKQPVPSRKDIAILFDEESQKKMAEATFKLDTKGVSFDLQLKMINLRKEEVWIRIVVEPIYNDQNKIARRRGVVQDITESKKARQELEFSKQKIQTTLELLERSEYSKNEMSKVAKIGYQDYDIETSSYLWSDYMYHVLEFDIKKGVPPVNDILSIFDEEDKKKIEKSTLEINSKGTPSDLELKYINSKKEEVWVRYIAQPVYDKQNKIVGRKGVLHNITDAKKAQFELELSKQKIQTSLDLLEKRKHSMDEASKIAKIGYHDYVNATDTFVWSEYLYHIFGLDAKKQIPSLKEILSFFDKESQKRMEKATNNLNLTGSSYDIELRIIKPNNEEVWVRNVTQPVYNQQNEII